MTLKIIHKRSTDVTGGVSDAPLPTDIEHGEIGINYADADPALFIKDSADVVRRLPLNASEENKKYSIANDDAGLVGADATAAINAALIANGDIADVAELGVSDQCDVTDSGNPDANPEVTVGRYWYDGAVWFLGGGNTLLTVSDTAPSNPIRGQLWVDTNEDPPVVKVWDDTPGPGAWVPVGIEDAPNDGQQYARQSEAWTVVQGDVEEAPIDGNQYARQNATWSVVQGGDNNVTYNGASAWGVVQGNGSFVEGLNCTSTRNSIGNYTITFTTPMPSDNYAITTGNLQANSIVEIASQDANGFNYLRKSPSAGTLTDLKTAFAVHSQNALPPAGTTGTDAWLTCSGSGVLGSSFNIASVVKAISPNGQYQVTFTNPMPTADYSVQVSHTSGYGYINVFNKTTAGFQVQCRNNAGVETDIAFQAAVNATNANLPYTFTKEQIEAAINNTGAYAWASTAADGTINGGNGLTCTRTGTGRYTYTFNTPLPDANYAVVGTSTDSNNNYIVKFDSQDANGFEVTTVNRGTTGVRADSQHSVVVTAAKGQPLSLGGGADAWASVASNGQLIQGHNIASVTRTGVGSYDVVFTTPMPTANYSVQSTLADLNTVSTTKIGNRTVDGFTVNTGYQPGSGTTWAPFDHNFSIAVFATDGNAGGFWGRTNAGVLTPANSTDDVQIASLNGGQLAGFRNVLCNGTVTINQRGLTYAGVAVGEYWADRWKKTAGGMTQIIEEGNYKPNTEYTLSGTGVTTQQITSPASGNWTIPDVPETATMIQLEEGPIPSPYELKPIQTELALCQRYYQSLGVRQTTTLAFSYTYQTAMRTTPTGTTTGDGSLVLQSSAFVVGSAAAAGGITVKLDAEL